MKSSPLSMIIAVAVLFTAVSSRAAHPIASPGTEGFPVVTSGGEVIATYQGTTASFSDDLFLELDALGNPGMDGNQSNDLFIFNNHSSPVGSTLSLGIFAPNVELVFRLFVQNTSTDYYSGLASRNPDSLAHARVQDNWALDTTLVSFEDLLNVPEGANGYNDLSFSFTNTRNTPAPRVPDGGATAALLAVGIGGLAALRRKMV